MKDFKYIMALSVLTLAGSVSCYSEESRGISSPDGKLHLIVPATGENDGKACFTVEYNNRCILSQARLGMNTDQQSFAGDLKLKSVSETKSVKDDYEMLTGKRSHCTNEAFERIYNFANSRGQELAVTFRVYNDGIAFKYGIKAVSADERLLNEVTTYPIPAGNKRWFQQYSKDYEGFYPLAVDGTSTVEKKRTYCWGYPALVEFRDSVFMLITEADIQRGHCASFLYNGIDPDEYQVRPATDNLPLKETWESPWRLLVIGSLADIVESTLVTDVSEPCKLADTDWIKPGAVSWGYWAYNNGSKDFKIVKDYIDLAVKMQWPYSLIDWKWNEMENGGDVHDALQYALKKGIKPLLWYNSCTAWVGSGAPGPIDRLNKKENREKEYQWLAEQGVAGVKIDFFAGDKVETMDYYLDLLEDAAKYKLMVNLHGATIPRGWQRTYPHLMTMEAVYGAEWYNNTPRLTPLAARHNATLPFTRNVVGSMDYTPGTFSDSQHPHITSHGHELALPVIFESGWQHMPDRPSVYEALPKEAGKLLSQLPAAWDDTKLLSGYPGESVVLARRKGNVWYIGGINGTDDKQTLTFTLDALPGLGKKIAIFKDGSEERQLDIKRSRLSKGRTLMSIDCLPRGGFIAVIE